MHHNPWQDSHRMSLTFPWPRPHHLKILMEVLENVSIHPRSWVLQNWWLPNVPIPGRARCREWEVLRRVAEGFLTECPEKKRWDEIHRFGTWEMSRVLWYLSRKLDGGRRLIVLALNSMVLTNIHTHTDICMHIYTHTCTGYSTLNFSWVPIYPTGKANVREDADRGLSPGGTASSGKVQMVHQDSPCQRSPETPLPTGHRALQQRASPGAKAHSQNQETVRSKVWHLLRKDARLKNQWNKETE